MMTEAEQPALALPRKVIEALLSASQEALSFRKGRTISVGTEEEARAAYIRLHNAASFADEALRRSARADVAAGSWVVAYRHQGDDVGFWKSFVEEDAAVSYLKDRLANGAAEVSLTSRPLPDPPAKQEEQVALPLIEVTEGDVEGADERAAQRIRIGASDIVAFTDQELTLAERQSPGTEGETIELYGSHGAIEACTLTGEIIRYDGEGDAYRMHVRVDIDEFIIRTEEYPEGSYDILDFALFNRDGTHAPAELGRAAEGWDDFFAATEEARTSG